MIWCVEDDASIRDIELYALTSTGFEARGFDDGASFWEALQTETPEQTATAAPERTPAVEEKYTMQTVSAIDKEHIKITGRADYGKDYAGLYYRRMNEARIFTSGVYSLAKWEIPEWLVNGLQQEPRSAESLSHDS